MKIQIDGVEILEIDPVHMKALNWRLADPKLWIKRAIIGQISHARDEMIEKEMKRVQGKEEGMPQSMQKEHLIEWLSSHSSYKDAKQKQEASRLEEEARKNARKSS